jgi:hypothetical protein
MKKTLKLLAMAILLSIIYFGNTSFYYGHYYQYVPVFMERSELEKSVFFQETTQELKKPGKIYYKAPYLYINERYKGVHIFDNSNPAQPTKKGFIVAPGCIDMAIKENILYIDNSVDLVAFDLGTKQVTKRIKEVFPEPLSPDNLSYVGNRKDGLVLIGWKEIKK